MVQVGGDLLGDRSLGDAHCFSLHVLVAFIHRVFLMLLDQHALVVINLLPESHCLFVGIHFLEITRLPTEPAWNVEPVAPPPIGQLFPLAELLFILHPRAHPDPQRNRQVFIRQCLNRQNLFPFDNRPGA